MSHATRNAPREPDAQPQWLPWTDAHVVWDPHSAEALTRLYETVAATSHNIEVNPYWTDEDGSSSDPALPDEPEDRWPGDGFLDELDEPFNAMTRRIEQAFARGNPDSSVLALSLRLDDLERRVEVAIAAGPGLRQAGDGSSMRPESAGDEPSRLDGIEDMLEHVVDRLSDERLARLLAESHGPPAAQPETPSPPLEIAEIADRLEELSGLVDRVIDDQRRGNEALMTTLAAVQETVLRVLDRLDRSEPDQSFAAASARTADPVPAAFAEAPLVAEPRGVPVSPDSPRASIREWMGAGRRMFRAIRGSALAWPCWVPSLGFGCRAGGGSV